MKGKGRMVMNHCDTLMLQSFPELIELASKGNERRVNTYMSDLAAAAQGSAKGDSSNIYGAVDESGYDGVVYFFGKAADASPQQIGNGSFV